MNLLKTRRPLYLFALLLCLGLPLCLLGSPDKEATGISCQTSPTEEAEYKDSPTTNRLDPRGWSNRQKAVVVGVVALAALATIYFFYTNSQDDFAWTQDDIKKTQEYWERSIEQEKNQREIYNNGKRELEEDEKLLSDFFIARDNCRKNVSRLEYFETKFADNAQRGIEDEEMASARKKFLEESEHSRKLEASLAEAEARREESHRRKIPYQDLLKARAKHLGNNNVLKNYSHQLARYVRRRIENKETERLRGESKKAKRDWDISLEELETAEKTWLRHHGRVEQTQALCHRSIAPMVYIPGLRKAARRANYAAQEAGVEDPPYSPGCMGGKAITDLIESYISPLPTSNAAAAL